MSVTHAVLPPHKHCRYIRYIYNRIILENATVRAAAVSALANFGAKVGRAATTGVRAFEGPRQAGGAVLWVLLFGSV